MNKHLVKKLECPQIAIGITPFLAESSQYFWTPSKNLCSLCLDIFSINSIIIFISIASLMHKLSSSSKLQKNYEYTSTDSVNAKAVVFFF